MIFVSKILSFALMLQALEMLYLCRQSHFFKVWSYSNLKNDLNRGLPLPQFLIEIIFSDRMLSLFSLTQIVLAAACILNPQLVLILSLFFIQLVVCIRFRGNFNGGSDMMSFVVLTGVLISFLYNEKWGLIYILIHLMYSYFKAGFVKVLNADWRRGLALPIFLSRSLFTDIRSLGEWLRPRKGLCLFLSWCAILFELGVPALVFLPNFFFPVAMMALIFHFCVYWTFGLNRFFWIWLSAWSAAYIVL